MDTGTVLIIDDEADFSYLLKIFFLRKNCRVFLTHSLSEGISILDSVTPDIIFLDNNLPDGMGWEKKELILEKCPNTRLSLISGAQFSIIPGSSFNFLEKPITINELNRLFS